MIMAYLLIPFYEELVGLNVFESIDLRGYHWMMFFFLIITGVTLSSVYPALVLSSFAPVSILKGRMVTSQKGTLLRKGLVILQFSVCLVLMAFIYALNGQIELLRHLWEGHRIEDSVGIQ